jgi:branched-chain amino acid aminotransferase
MVKKGVIYTPNENILMGITRQTVFEIAAEAGFAIELVLLTQFDLYNADEVFFTSTAGGIFAVAEVDGRQVGSGVRGPVTKLISEGYQRLLESGKFSTPAYLD